MASRLNTRPQTMGSELDDLQRKYRMMEVNRKTYSEDSQNTIRMQRQQITKLKKESDRLKEDLALETRQARLANNMTASAQIARLQDQADVYSRKIEIEKRRITELNKKIETTQEVIKQQRKELGGVNAFHESNVHVQKVIQNLENRYEKAEVKFNRAQAHNRALQDTIGNLRRERTVFEGIQKKLSKELAEKKKKMAEIIDISNAAYEARDKAQEEMIALKRQADLEQTKFEMEWTQLGQLIEKDRKMKAYLNSDENPSPQNADPALVEERELRKKVIKGAWGIAKDKGSIHFAMEKVQSYEEAFAKIQKATKILDIDELTETFISAEDQNFALFNQVNELSNTIKALEEKTVRIQEETKKFKGHGLNDDIKRKKIIAGLEGKLSSTDNATQFYEQKYDTASTHIGSLKEGIERIFEKIGCSDAVMTVTLKDAGVTENNIMQYLGIIEDRTNELLRLYSECGGSDDVNTETGEVAQPKAVERPPQASNPVEPVEEPPQASNPVEPVEEEEEIEYGGEN